MIHKNKAFGQVEGVTILDFQGDIGLAPAGGNNKGYECIVFKNTEKQEIGQELEGTAGMNTDDFKPEVVMIFNNHKSIDVVIDALQKAKEVLILKPTTKL